MIETEKSAIESKSSGFSFQKYFAERVDAAIDIVSTSCNIVSDSTNPILSFLPAFGLALTSIIPIGLALLTLPFAAIECVYENIRDAVKSTDKKSHISLQSGVEPSNQSSIGTDLWCFNSQHGGLYHTAAVAFRCNVAAIA